MKGKNCYQYANSHISGIYGVFPNMEGHNLDKKR